MGNCCGGRGLGKSLSLEELTKATYIEHNSQRASFRPNKLNCEYHITAVPEILEESKDYISMDSAFPESAHAHSKAILSPSKFKRKWTLFSDLYQVTRVVHRGRFELKSGVFCVIEEIQHLSSGILLQAYYFLSRSKEEQEIVKEKLNRLMAVDHPNLVKIHDFYIQGSTVIVVTDRDKNSTLLQNSITSAGFTSQNLTSIAKQIFSTLQSLLNQGVFFSEFTSSSVILNNGKDGVGVKVSKITNQECFRSPRVRSWFKDAQSIYRAPELISLRQATAKSNVYSVGVLLLLTACGQFPTGPIKASQDGGHNLSQLVPIHQEVDPKLIDLLQKMLAQNPQKRLDVNQFLQHPWIMRSQGPLLEVEEEISVHSLLKSKKRLRAERVRHAFLTYISSTFEIEERADALGSIFLNEDESASGTLSKTQFVKSIVELGMSELYAQETVNKIFLENRFNQNKNINYSEFLDSYGEELERLSTVQLMNELKEYLKTEEALIEADLIRSILELPKPAQGMLQNLNHTLKDLLNNSAGLSIRIEDILEELKELKREVSQNTMKHMSTQELILGR